MRYKIENSKFCVTVESFGAELISVINKTDDTEHIWQADPDIWKRSAPILFPYTGKLTNGEYIVNGKTYKGGQHGFARDMEHTLINRTDDELVFRLCSNDETLRLFPFDFILTSCFKLEDNNLIHTVKVTNSGKETMSFGLGYHPGFICPFDKYHDTEDYEFRFDTTESPLVIDCSPNGLLSGDTGCLGENITSIPLTDELFSNDSICLSELKSETFGIYEKNSDRNITCTISGFPYVLIWSPYTEKVQFVCIEPWLSLPGKENGSTLWEDKTHAATLNSNESFETCMKISFNL